MKKTLIFALVLSYANFANANSDPNECRYSTDFNIDISEERIVFDKKNAGIYEFYDDRLVINGKQVVLTEQQLEASQKLQQGTRDMLPKIGEIAVEGVELGIKATTLVLTSLFGDDEKMRQELLQPIEAISDKIKTNITANKMNTQALEQSFEQAFDEEFKKIIETAVTQYSGRIVSNVISSIFSGDSEEIKDLEFRMENLEQEMEQYIEANAKELEAKAKVLCQDIAKLDEFDKILESLLDYPKNGLLQQGNNKVFKFKNLSFDN